MGTEQGDPAYDRNVDEPPDFGGEAATALAKVQAAVVKEQAACTSAWARAAFGRVLDVLDDAARSCHAATCDGTQLRDRTARDLGLTQGSDAATWTAQTSLGALAEEVRGLAVGTPRHGRAQQIALAMDQHQGRVAPEIVTGAQAASLPVGTRLLAVPHPDRPDGTRMIVREIGPDFHVNDDEHDTRWLITRHAPVSPAPLAVGDELADTTALARCQPGTWVEAADHTHGVVTLSGPHPGVAWGGKPADQWWPLTVRGVPEATS